MIATALSLSSALAALSALWAAVPAQQNGSDLTEFSLEDLMRMDVSVASHRNQPFQRVSAAAFVITEEDIRRSGATSLPEALRGVPGLHVAQIDQSKWMVSIRGFNGRFASKLLVLIDGRSVYTPLFSGVFWNLIDIPLSEIDRIEIVRGPGGALWGTNAVNGTINVITKHAATTLGTSLSIGSGTKEIYNASLRYGDIAGDNGFWRFYIDGGRTLNSTTNFGARAADDWGDLRLGARLDINTSDTDSLTLDVSSATVFEGMTMKVPTFTGILSEFQDRRSTSSQYATALTWKRDLGAIGSDSVKAYIEISDHNHPEVGERRTTASIEYVGDRALSDMNRLSFGGGYKYTVDKTSGTDLILFDPSSAALTFWSAFLSDTIDFDSNWTLDLTTKFESSAGGEGHFLPSVSLLYAPNDRSAYWLSASHTMRTASRIEQGIDINVQNVPGPGMVIRFHLIGDGTMKPEKLDALQAGARFQSTENLTLDFALFYNRYYDLRTFEIGALTFETDPVDHLRQEFTFGNMLNAETAGFEASADLRLPRNARITAAYSLFSESFRLDPASTDPFGAQSGERSGVTPKHQLTFTGHFPTTRSSSLNFDLYVVDSLAVGGVPAYVRLDLRYISEFANGVTLSAGARNLFGDQRVEGIATLYDMPSRIPTQFYINYAWKF